MKPLLSFSLLFTIAASVIADTPCRRSFRFADVVVTGVITSAVYGDFDEDGRADIAVMLGNVRIVALNRGGHLFEPLPRQALLFSGLTAPLVAATDVNRDGHLDLVYRIYNTISVALGDGHGAFGALSKTVLQNNSDTTWRLVDFNHDGLLDFVGLYRTAVTFEQSRGDGTFSVVATDSIGGGNVQSEVTLTGDFDGDGQFDALRVATDIGVLSTVERFDWNDGTFHFTRSDEQVALPLSVQPIDIDGDGAEELVAIDKGSLVIGRAKNRRLTVQSFAVAPPGASIGITDPVMADTDGDGINDLVFNGGNEIGIVRRTANGFDPAVFYGIPGATGLQALDLDGDGRADFAPSRGTSGLPVLFDGNASRVYPLAFRSRGFDYADVDGDGKRDLIGTADSGNFSVQVLYGDGTGSFPRAGQPFVIADSKYQDGRSFTADYDGDGRADLAIAPVRAGAKPMLSFGSAAGFDAPSVTIDADELIGRVELGASQAPGLIVRIGDDIALITVSSGRQLSVKTIYHRPAGAAVVVVRTVPGAPAQLGVLAGTGLRIVTRAGDVWNESTLTSTSAFSVSSVTSADLDHDGRTDYLVVDTSTLRAYFATGDQTFETSFPGPTTGSPDTITAADLDHDGLLDLLITSRKNVENPGNAQILRNAGGRTFETYSMAATMEPYRNGVVVDDLDGDGWTDVVIPTIGGAEVLTNTCIGPRLDVVASPAVASPGGHVNFIVHARSTDAFSVGSIFIDEGGKTLEVLQPNPAYGLATIAWTSPSLTAGAHTYTIRYVDQYGGTSEKNVTVVAGTPRRRAAR